MPFRGGGGDEESTTQLFEVVRGDLTISVSGSGSIGVANETKLAFDGGGEVDKIYVDEGDEVRQGEVVAELVPLDAEALELALLQAEIALHRAEYNLDKARHPYTDDEIEDAEDAVDDAEDYLDFVGEMLAYARWYGSDQEVQQWQMELYRAEASLDEAEDRLEAMLSAPDEDEIEILEMEVDAAEQAVDEAEAALEVEKITAPFDGVVTSVDVEEGDIIPASGMSQVTIVHLIDPTSMELSVDLDEIDIPDVRLNQRAVIEVDALPDVQLEGRVISISPLPTVEAGVVLYNVKIGFDVPWGSGLKVGMSATADIITDERSSVLLVPDRAIKQDEEGNTIVWVMVDEEVEVRPIVIGISDGFQTEIIDGLDEGEMVAVEIQAEPEPSGGGGFIFR
jgi:HlyD family secretion protein